MILMYLSRDIAHKLRMEAVEHITSELIQVLQASFSRGHFPLTSFTMAKGITKRATLISI